MQGDEEEKEETERRERAEGAEDSGCRSIVCFVTNSTHTNDFRIDKTLHVYAGLNFCKAPPAQSFLPPRNDSLINTSGRAEPEQRVGWARNL